ncbi:hypothetical protein PT274_01435 [Leuconostocaceae bacterium ESL0958]|nr:hypothetical protein [Leuconostocaceae bacterium ESL0958]
MADKNEAAKQDKQPDVKSDDKPADVKPVMRFTKRQFVSLSSYPGPQRDLYKVALKEGKKYTKEEADQAVKDLFERI